MKNSIFLTIIFLILTFSVKAQEEVPCKIIREVHYPVTKTEPSKQPLRIALLNLCPENPGMEARPMITLFIKGKAVMREYVVDKVFANQEEADKYAKENNIKEPTEDKFSENLANISDCQIIRTIDVPLTKKKSVKKQKKIALLNTCLDDKPPLQRPVIEVIRDGQKVYRTFGVIKTFANKKEAEKYAKENNINDIKF